MTVEALVEFRQLVFASAMKLARNRDDAEDLTQSTFLKALEALPRFDGRYPKAWLLRILYRTFLDFKRREHRYVPLVGDNFESTQDVPRQAIARIELKQVLAEAEPYVLAAVMHKQTELRGPLGSTHARIFRGRKVLRQKYA